MGDDRRQAIHPPIDNILYILHVLGSKLEAPNYRFMLRSTQIDNIVMETYDEKPPNALKPVFHMVWNAAGFPCSANFDANGKWKHQTI